MDFSLVTFSQISEHAQMLSMFSSAVCMGFAAVMIFRYHKFYTTSTQLLLYSIVAVCLFCLEGSRHMSLLTVEHISHVTAMSCRTTMCTGLFMVLMAINHDRLISSVRREFTETTSIVEIHQISHLTRTQQIKIVENSDYNDMLETLNLITSSRTKRLLKTMKMVGWTLIISNLCFLAMIEAARYLGIGAQL